MSEAQQPLNALPPSHRLQEYELVRVLGMGGFGITYLGFDHNLDKGVAIKEYLPSDLATRTADDSVAPQASQFRGDFQWGLERFLDEARTLARFDHRHIIKVHRFFEAHGTAYIVMEYAEGETLSEYLDEREGPLSETELKGILDPLLDGLEVVHGADFLHRDIKPANIVIRAENGSPVLLDFGAARQAIGAKSRSVTSIVTPGYAPIEQYSERGHQGAWTDLYALGAVCYRALTGQVPVEATARTRDDPLVPVSSLCASQASGAFLSAIEAALSVYGEDRPQSVKAWRAMLEAEKPADDSEQPQPLLSATEVALERQRQTQAVEEARLAAEQAEKQRRQEQEERRRLEQAAEAAAVLRRMRKRRQEKQAVPKKKSRLKRLTVVLGVVVVFLVSTIGMLIGATPLHYAAWQDASEVAALLLKQGADIHAKSNSGATPLHYAAKYNASEVAALLLKQGADIHAKSDGGQTPLHYAAKYNASEVAALLLKQGADIHAKSDGGQTPLHYAAWQDASEVAALLLKQGADIHAKSDGGQTPLHYAAWQDASEVAALLLKQGADIHAKSDNGETPLHYVAWQDASEVAALLLKQGAYVNAKDKLGNTPLRYAEQENASATVEVLRRYGGRK